MPEGVCAKCPGGIFPTDTEDRDGKTGDKPSDRAEGTATLPGVFVTVHGQAMRLNSVSNAHETQD